MILNLNFVAFAPRLREIIILTFSLFFPGHPPISISVIATWKLSFRSHINWFPLPVNRSCEEGWFIVVFILPKNSAVIHFVLRVALTAFEFNWKALESSNNSKDVNPKLKQRITCGRRKTFFDAVNNNKKISLSIFHVPSTILNQTKSTENPDSTHRRHIVKRKDFDDGKRLPQISCCCFSPFHKSFYYFVVCELLMSPPYSMNHFFIS